MKGLGNRIRELRKSRRMTLIDMAKKTDIDQATLSRIENGIMTGTLASHMKIAESLGIPLPDLYEEVLEKVNEKKENAARKKLESFSSSSGAVTELLTSGILQKKMMPVLLKVRPGGRTEPEEYPSLTERLLYVVKGSLEAHIGDEKKTLSEGGCLYFNASEPHRFTNPGRSECWCLSVMTPVAL